MEQQKMKCLIIAAGKGRRLQRQGDVKPLIPILGVPLIERVIRCAIEAGADEFFVVTGYQEERLRSFLSGLTDRLERRITPIFNPEWEKENGLSVLTAKKYLQAPFLLLMSDHLFDPAIARNIAKLGLPEDKIVLGVDGDTGNSAVDMGDVTRVKTQNGKILDIGKGLTDFNGFDTGIFLCSPAIFDALEQGAKDDGDTTLSGAVRILAAEGKAAAFEIGSRFWIDVDDPAAFQRAEDAILSRLKGKPKDGPVSRHLNRPLSMKISRRLVNYPVTPNQISLSSFFCSILAAGLFALPGYWALLMGGFLAKFASVIDGCDGEVARLTYQSSEYGGWFDAVLDRYADALLLFGLMWHAYADKNASAILMIGFLAIIGSFMLSYTADKHDSLMRSRINSGRGLRMGRDIRVFLIFLGAVFNQAYLTLVVIAAVMNIATVHRLIICRNHDYHRLCPETNPGHHRRLSRSGRPASCPKHPRIGA
jgi:1L-myo-inositol 1-phosphate cytidylyltransferase / CDP-L-myo-inositol myo-inositolphosphotransferase